MDGYSGKIPQLAIKYKLQPLVNAFWSLVVKSNGTGRSMTEITQLSSELNPLHARRMEAFGVKRGRDEHSAFLHKLKMCLDNADLKA